MSNKYLEMKKKHQKIIDAFDGWFFAFSKEQFNEGMKKVGLNPEDTDKILRIFGGGFVLKERVAEMEAMFDKNYQEMQEAIKADVEGTGFIYDMFLYELENHEYSYTGEVEDTLDALGFEIDEVLNNAQMSKGLCLAIETCMQNTD